jgi:hypothetical protein
MNDDANAMKNDISYMRTLAEQGRSGPIYGGAFLVIAGSIFGIACLVQWVILAANLPVTHDQCIVLWRIATGVCGGAMAALFVRLYSCSRKKPVVGNAPNSAFAIAFTGCAIGVIVSTLAIAFVAKMTHAPETQQLFGPIIFAFYGVAWCVAGAMARRTWMYLASAVAFSSTLALVVLAGDIAELLAFGIALLFTLVVPGVKLVLDEKR